MKKMILLLVVAMTLLNCSINVYAKETAVKSEITENNDVEFEPRASATDIKTIVLEQVGQQIIPETPFKEDLVKNAEVIYRFRYKVTAKRVNNQVVTNLPIASIGYTGPVTGWKFTSINSGGVGYIDVDVRGAHNFTLFCRLSTSNVKSNTVSATPTVRANYAKGFYCTGYNTALESDYTGTKKSAPGIAGDTFAVDFLADVKLNGSGKANNGKYLHYNSSSQTYSYQSPITATGTTPTVDRTIAVDPYYIPRAKVNSVWKRAIVSIANVGTRVAEDGGSAIAGYRIDVYMGLGRSAMNGWGNATRAVTLISVN